MTFRTFCGAVGLTALVVFEVTYQFVKLADDGKGKAKRDNRPAAVPTVCPHCGCNLERTWSDSHEFERIGTG
jgi:hypothetical protein